jgi:hypothetical protein
MAHGYPSITTFHFSYPMCIEEGCDNEVCLRRVEVITCGGSRGTLKWGGGHCRPNATRGGTEVLKREEVLQRLLKWRKSDRYVRTTVIRKEFVGEGEPSEYIYDYGYRPGRHYTDGYRDTAIVGFEVAQLMPRLMGRPLYPVVRREY